MFDYTAYGLLIQSDLLLPELIAASGCETIPASRTRVSGQVALNARTDTAVRIRLARFDRRPPGVSDADAPTAQDSPHQSTAWATADAAILDYPGTAAFLIRRGEQILIDVAPDADAAMIRLFLLGPVLALLLHQRHFLVLHASAVKIDGEVIAFVGDKGMGKSTMAAAFHAAGYPLIADDLVAIDTAPDRPVAYPGFPQLKLFPESAALLDAAPGQLPKVNPHLDKRSRRSAEGFKTEPCPMGRIFVLRDGDIDRIEPLPHRQAFMELVRYSYLLGYLGATESAASHFLQAIALAGRVPVQLLNRRRHLDALPAAVRLVEESRERAA